MAKKYYDEKITLKTDWGGDETTNNLPVVGNRVQEVIKEGINSKVGYVGRVDRVGQGYYVLARDEETFNAYLQTISDDNPFGDIEMDGINGRFDAPFNYKMNITLLNPENGYKSTLLDTTGNIIKFTAQTLDASDTPQGENVTVTYKITTEGGVETSYTAIYDGNTASKGIEYNLDGKLSAGINTITITVVGMNTGISSMRRVTYRLIDMYIKDRFVINQCYNFTSEGTMSINIGYDIKGVGRTKIMWYFDGSLHEEELISNRNPNLNNQSKNFYFTENAHKWLTPGLHTLQFYMSCEDTDSGEEFLTPIYYREFVVEKTPRVLTTPLILRKTSFDYEKGVLKMNQNPTIYNIKEFENITLEYAVYYNAKSECRVTNAVKYSASLIEDISNERLPLVNDGGFSNIQNQIITLNNEGIAEIITRAYYGEEYFETTTYLDILPSDMNITTVEDSVVLYLNAFGRSNNTDGKDIWEYRYTDVYGIEQVISTKFSKNEYTLVSTKDIEDNVIAPSDATDSNSLIVSELPLLENENYKYLIFNNEYYIWDKEFDWSDTSGWHDNKLKLSKGNSITIDYKPFSSDKLKSIKENGATFEFEFETTNVYKDDAVICRICGNDNFAPGISIYASGAELVISRAIETEGDNVGYTKAVSTKYKAEENNRITFVVTPDSDDDGYRNRILSIYVNGEFCGAHDYAAGTNFGNDSKITFRGSEDACVNISSIKMYSRALNSNEILDNYNYYRNDTKEKTEVYRRNNIMLDNNNELFDADKLKSQLPILMIYQIDKNQSLDDIHQEKKNKKLTRFFDVVYIDIQNPENNFLVKNAYITPQGTSSMNYPVKNLRLYTAKKDKAGNYYSRLFVGSNIFLDGSTNNLDYSNINLETEVTGKRKYAFKNGAIPVNCWCLKADFAESSSSHNTGTARYWNNVLKSGGLSTKAQIKAEKYKDKYPYDVRTCIDGFPIVVFYQQLDGSSPRFEGKYNFNNDKSTEDVFGFTGGIEIENQEVKYFYIGKDMPQIHGEENEDTGEMEWTCSFEHGGYTETPNTKSPLYVSKYLEDGSEEWYMLRGKELLDNPKMECWELLNSVNEIALFKTMKGFGLGDGNEKVGIVDGEDFDEAFESRYPDCGDYFHTNSLKRFGEWLVSCRYLDVDDKTGMSVPFSMAALPTENYHKNDEGKLSICSLTKQTGEFKFDFPNKNFYTPVDYTLIASKIVDEGYQQISINDDIIESIEYLEVEALPSVKNEDYEYIKCGELFYTWGPSNLLVVDELPNTHETAYDYVLVGETYYEWQNTFKFEDFHETQWVEDSAFNRALKFSVEKYDHIEMNKMAAYYIYLMRFGGVDQTVKNSMLTTEGPANDDPNSTLPSLWYFINYDNDTILGVKNDGRLVFDPYITRETKDGTGYVYAGRESTLWNNLEADVEFMNHVTKIDNDLAKGEGNSLFALSYANALREYDANQSDKWCERIYNKDAERKYIDTFVKGWTQKIEADNSETHVYENYLYDVQGSRSAHRKWWLGRRFNVLDSKFCNTNFRNSLIKFRSTNLPAGSSFTLKSGEPIFYAWGHDNSVTEMTPTAIQPGETYTFTTKSAFNIGSYLELMGSSNISTLDLRNCVGALTEIDITGCYSPLVGTKLKELLIGDNERNDLINVSNTNMKFSGLGNATKLEVLDITNIKNVIDIDGLNNLLNINKVYAKGTSISNFTFAGGANIERIELPSTVETLSLTRSSSINYDNIIFEDNNYGKLTNLTIDNCSNLMSNSNFVLNWIGSRTEAQRRNLKLNLQGINWRFGYDYNNLYLLENISNINIRGVIEITEKLTVEDVNKLKNIFGNECFKEGAQVYIKAPVGIYVSGPLVLWEGDTENKFEITTVGTTLKGRLSLIASVNEMVNGEKVNKIIDATNGNITMDESNIDKEYVYVNVKESDKKYEEFVLKAVYVDENNYEREGLQTSFINKRIYPNSVVISSTKDSFNNKIPNMLKTNFTPNEINNFNLVGRGLFETKWEIVSGSTNYENSVSLKNENEETAYIQAPLGFDGQVNVKVSITRIYDNRLLCSNTKTLEFTNPDTIITSFSNKPIYDVLVSAGIIKEDESGFGKLTKNDASMLTMEDFVKNGKSIFADNSQIESFVEFQYFNNTLMGQMPNEAFEEMVVTPNGMFKNCTNLKEISFSDNFKYTAKDMFVGCRNLEHIYGEQLPITSEDEAPIYTNLSFEEVGDNFASGCTKLHTCLLSAVTKKIGKNAFCNCESLELFRIPTSSNLVMVCDNQSTPFVGCKNITFEGAEYGNVSISKYQVKNGACYCINDDGTLTLIHMGKNSVSSEIPTDKHVYALSYSMEYRTEPNVVIPENVEFNGESIFKGSVGNSVVLKNMIGNNNASRLFESTKYKGNYTFAKNETIIPARCFYQSSDFSSFVVPEGIVVVKDSAFYQASGLESISFPSTLTSIESNALWLTRLNEIIFNSPTPPSIYDDFLYGHLLPNIYTKPEYIETYKNNKDNLKAPIAPFIKPIKLYNEGYIRIIKDGNYIVSDSSNVVTVGGLSVVQYNDYMKYTTSTDIADINVYLNGKPIGEICEKYTTIYIGDNSSLFSGDGYNLRYGVYDQTLKQQLEQKGWVYDARFKGVRSNPNIQQGERTEIKITLPSYSNKNTPITYGMYALLRNNEYYGYINDSSNNRLLNITTNGFENKTSLQPTLNGIFNIGFIGSVTKTGINGIVLNEIGESIYSDPELPAIQMMMDDEESPIRIVTVSLDAAEEIPSNVYITVTDNKAHTYRKYWNGQPCVFVLPNNSDFVVSATDFVTEDGKSYYLKKSQNVDNNYIELKYDTLTNMSVKNNILTVPTNNTDWYIYLNKQKGKWSEDNIMIPEVTTDEIISSDANGLENTLAIAKTSQNSIFNEVAETKIFGDNIKGYIPSFVELELFNDYIIEINDFLQKKNLPKISLNDVWVSEAYDETMAWTSEGDIEPKNNEKYYYIFGRKITN